MRPNALDSDVPPLNSRRGPSGPSPLNSASQRPADPKVLLDVLDCCAHARGSRQEQAEPVSLACADDLCIVLVHGADSTVVGFRRGALSGCAEGNCGSNPGTVRRKSCIQDGRRLKPCRKSSAMVRPVSSSPMTA